MSTERFTSGIDANNRGHTRKQVGTLIKLSGVICNYRCTRSEASFVFTDADRNTMGVISIAAGVAGLSGQAISTASFAASVAEDADYVEFDLDGTPVKGWLWRSPLKEGDYVEVAAESRGEHYEAGAIVRPADRTIAMYPHCSRGRIRHIRTVIKWWLIGMAIWIGLQLFLTWSTGGLDLIFDSNYFYYMVAGSCAFFGLMTISLARKWMPFVRLTEKLCRTLDLPNPGNVDLVASSKRQRKEDDPGEFGTFYFRY